MAFSMAGGGPSGPQINVTPLIDVLLTLIMMFMLVVAMDRSIRRKCRFRSRQKRRCVRTGSRAHGGDSGGLDDEGHAADA